MAIANTTSNLTNLQNVFAVSTFLTRGQPTYVLDAFASPPQSIDMHNTLTAKWRRYERMAAITAPLSEGVTPPGTAFSPTDYTATLQQYGNWAPVSDVVLDTNDDQPRAVKEFMGVLGEQAAESMERIGWATAVGGTNVEFQNGVIRSSVNTAPTRSKLRKICAAMDAAYAKKLTEVQASSAKFDSVSIEPAYVGVCHTNAAWNAFRDMDGFKQMSDYAATKFHPAEFGTCEGIRFLSTQLIPTYPDMGGAAGAMETDTGANANVYVTMIFARECFGSVPLKGRTSVNVVWKNPEHVVGDELAQHGFGAWKTYRTYVRLNEPWLKRWEHSIVAPV